MRESIFGQLTMYHQYFGLNEAPFSISVNPRYLFMSPRHRDALAHLLYGVGSGGGFILLTGEVGTGKTTVNRCLLEQLPDTTDLAIILNPALSAVELLATACDELTIDYPKGTSSLKVLTDALHRFLLTNHQAGRRTVLMIDEAQHLDFDVLEQIRLLTNLETNEQKLLQIILIGQPELVEKLARPELRQLNQRITARYHLQPLNLDETDAYIRHRLQVAGLAAGRQVFPSAAVKDIHRRTRGIPRLINLLCDRTLLGAYGRQSTQVSRAMVGDAAAEVFGGELSNKPMTRFAWLGFGVMALLLMLAGGVYWLSDVAVRQPAGSLVESAVPQRGNPLPSGEQAGSAARSMAAAPATTPSWMLPVATADSWLWRLNSDAPRVADICAPSPATGLRCGGGNASVWDELIALQRPVVINVRTPDRFAASAVIVAFAAPTDTDEWRVFDNAAGLPAQPIAAWLIQSERGLARVPLAQLADAWTGEYQYLWQAPSRWDRPLSLGDQSVAVQQVALLFAQLDGQEIPLTTDIYSPLLEQRVKIFQAQMALLNDGVVGERTLLRLNDQLGIGLNPERALRRAQQLLGVR